MKTEVWIFGSGNGNNFSDNSRALFEYVATTKSGIVAIWLTKSKKTCHHVRSKGYRAYTFYSPMGMYYSFRAHVIVLTNSFRDVGLTAYLQPRKKFIAQLWHGTPLKVLENMRWQPGKRLLMDAFLKYINRDCDLLFSATALNTETYIKNFRIDGSKIAITGQPRNDFLFRSKNRRPEIKEIWYVPTFREYDKEFDFFTGLNFVTLDAFLEKNHARLLIKLHNVDSSRFTQLKELFTTSRNITLVDPENLYEELGRASILLTDYSSVYFDFLLLDRPIIFTAFDYEKYKTLRNFYYDYDEVTPGPKAKDWNEIQELLEQIFSGEDLWAEQRASVSAKFNFYNDANSSQRVFNSIVKRAAI